MLSLWPQVHQQRYKIFTSYREIIVLPFDNVHLASRQANLILRCSSYLKSLALHDVNFVYGPKSCHPENTYTCRSYGASLVAFLVAGRALGRRVENK